MPRGLKKSSEHIELLPAAAEQESVLANLLELYVHDFSEFHDVELGDNGRFGYKHLPKYWSEPGRYPFLIQVDGKLAGLVLMKRGSEISGDETIWDMAEFFVVRAYRRRGIGMSVAHEMWRKFPGVWEIRVMQSNRAALDFWQRAVTTFVGRAIHPTYIQKDKGGWYVFAFECKDLA